MTNEYPNKPKNCPFCGSVSVLQRNNYYDSFWVECDPEKMNDPYSCRMSGPQQKTKEQAINAWNRFQEWKEAIDEKLIVSLQTTIESYNNPHEAIKDLLDFEVQIATDPRTNGGFELCPVQKDSIEDQEFDKLMDQMEDKYNK